MLQGQHSRALVKRKRTERLWGFLRTGTGPPSRGFMVGRHVLSQPGETDRLFPTSNLGDYLGVHRLTRIPWVCPSKPVTVGKLL